jgi:hypothetical protein
MRGWISSGRTATSGQLRCTARAHCQTFFAWYNDEHRHSGIAHMTPHNVHYSLAHELIKTRQAALDAAFAAHSSRFKGKRPEPARLPTAAWINPPLKKWVFRSIVTGHSGLS